MKGTRKQQEKTALHGVVFWCFFCFVAVLLRGVRWDENHEFAQVILGQVPYPEDHPLAQYTSHFFSLQTWSLAGLMRFLPRPRPANLLRNFLSLASVVLPAFLMTTLLTRRARWGHAAALLMLMGIHQPFYSNYPVQVWPGLYSNGVVGLGWALTTFYLLLAGRYRCGYLMAGLMPAIHLGQFPPLLAILVLRLAWSLKSKRHDELRAALKWGGAGLGICLVFLLIQRSFALPPPTAGAYFSSISPETVFRGYMEHHASHRSIPWGTGHIAMLMTLLLTAAMAWKRRRNEPDSPWTWIFLYTLAACGTVWGIMLIHILMGPAIPWIFISWLPYRLINHCSPLLIPVMLSVIAGMDEVEGGYVMDGVDTTDASSLRSSPRSGRNRIATGVSPWTTTPQQEQPPQGAAQTSNAALLITAALLYGTLQPLMPLLTGTELYDRDLATGESVYFGLFGAAAALFAAAPRLRFRAVWIAFFIAGLLALGWRHQFGAACCVLGGTAALILRMLPRLTSDFSMKLLTTTACILLASTLLWQQARNRRYLPVSDFEKEVREVLHERGDDKAMILVRHQQEGLQARLHHPVMTDMATITWIPYRPALGPSLYKLYRDLYGINFAPDGEEQPCEMPWFEVWPSKSRADWQRLAGEYNFHYVLAPAFMKLDLPRILEGDQNHLYEIPCP